MLHKLNIMEQEFDKLFEKYFTKIQNFISQKLSEENKIQDNISPTYLRSREIRKLLNVSENKLRSMRDNGEIPFSFIGSTYYYPKEEILEILKKNTINNQLINN